MNTYPAVRDPGSIELLFKVIRLNEHPDRITTDFLASVGFRRQSDVKLLELLFFLGFIDSDLSPSDLWADASGSDDTAFAALLADAISKAYSTVFEHYPRGESIDGKALMVFFRDQTGVSDTEAAYMVLTLQVISDIADFSKSGTAQPELSEPAVPAPEQKPAPVVHPLPDVSGEPAPTIEIPQEGLSLNITIPPEAMDREMADIVKALLKRLL